MKETKADVKETKADVKETKADTKETKADAKETKADVKEIINKMETRERSYSLNLVAIACRSSQIDR